MAGTIFKIRRDTAANWSSNNPTLAAGEMGLDQTNNFIKMGDGSTAWNSLPQFTQNIENVEDLVGAMVTSNTETFISVTYDDSDGTLDFVVPVLDEDDLSTDSATHLATQQSIKAYVDAQVTAQDLDFQGDSGGALSIDLDSESLTIAGGTGIDTVGSGNSITASIDSTVTTLTGSQTLTNKTLTSPVLNTGISGTAIKDEDDMASDSATHLATQQSIKAYVDAQVDTADALSELADTTITSPADGSMLLYDTGNSVWIDNVMSGDATLADTGAITLATVNSNVGSFGSTTAIPVITVNAKGLITAASTASITTSLTVGADSGSDDTVALATDTLNFTGGTGIDTTVSDNDISIAIDSTVATLTGTQTLTNKTLTNPTIASINGNVTIGGNLTVSGTQTTVSSTTVNVADPMLSLATNNDSADAVDIGFYGLYDTSGSQDLYSGLFRDASDSGKWKLYKDSQAEPTTTVNVSATGHTTGTLVANLEGNVTGDLTGDVTGDVTGNVSGTAATVTGAAQTAITSLGTLTALDVDNININGNTISSTAGTDLNITPLAGQQIVLDGAINVDAGVVTGATSITSTAFVGDLTGDVTGDVTGNADTATTLATARTIAGQSFNGSADITIASTDLSNTSAITLNTASQTLTNKTLTSPVLNTGVSGTAILDEDDMSSDSATQLATQQSIKAYVDSQVTAQDLDFAADSGGSLSIDLDSEALTFTGGTGIDTSGSGNAVTFAIDSTVTTLTGTQTLTNKTLTSPTVTSPVLNTGVSGSAVKDEDDMSSNSATHLATQQSIKAYVDAQTTDETAEGSNNLYYTEERVDDRVSALIVGGTNVTATYDDANNRLTISATTGASGYDLAANDTDDLSEGSANLYFTDERAQDAAGAQIATNGSHTNITATYDDNGDGAIDLSITDAVIRGKVSVTDAGGDGSLAYNNSTGVITYTGPSAAEARAHISVTDSGGDGSLAYNNSTGVITYTGPSAAEVRAHLSAGTGVTYSGGAISIGQSVATDADVTFDDVVVSGNLTVNGTTTTAASTNTVITDKLIELGNGQTGSPSGDLGLVFERGSSDNAFIGFDESADKFIVGTGSFTGASTGNLTITTGTMVANLEGATASLTGNITVGGTVDGRDVAADGTKLDGIESAATADQTGAEIKALYEAETSAFTDAQFTKLANIEANADVTDATNVNAAGAVMLSDTTTSGMGFVVDEDNMASDSATKLATQQSIKAYVDAREAAITTAYTAADATQDHLSEMGGTLDDIDNGTTHVKSTNDFTDAALAKLGGIEALADVTDATNVEAAGAVMESGANASAKIPSGTTAQRDGSPSAGFFRWNTTTSSAEIYDGSEWGLVGGGNTTGKVMWEHSYTVAEDYEITSGNNALTAGPITINSGYSVTVPSGSTWVVV